MPEITCGCGCNSVPSLVFSCSGAADVGEISDKAARKLNDSGTGKMFCLAGVGGHVNNILMSTSAAGKILAIDGCPFDCAKKTLEHAGFADIMHIRITDYGYTKGKTPVSEDTISDVVSHGQLLLSPEG